MHASASRGPSPRGHPREGPCPTHNVLVRRRHLGFSMTALRFDVQMSLQEIATFRSRLPDTCAQRFKSAETLKYALIPGEWFTILPNFAFIILRQLCSVDCLIK